MNLKTRTIAFAVLTAAALSVSVWAQSAVQVQPGVLGAPAEPKLVLIEVGARMMTALYHRPGCPWVRGGGDSEIRQFEIAEAKKRYYQPHCECITGKASVPPCGASSTSSGSTNDAAAVDAPTTAGAGVTAAPLLEKAAPAAAPARPIATKPAATVTRCQATTQKNRQCLRNAQPGRSYCWQH